jgi:hypothetical protein
MATLWYPKGLNLALSGGLNFASDTIRALAVNASHTYNLDHDFVNDVTANEISGGSYARLTLSSTAVNTTTIDSTNRRVAIDAADLTFATPSSGTLAFVIIYKFITDDASSPLICQVDNANVTMDGNNVTVQFSANGIVGLTVTSA